MIKKLDRKTIFITGMILGLSIASDALGNVRIVNENCRPVLGFNDITRIHLKGQDPARCPDAWVPTQPTRKAEFVMPESCSAGYIAEAEGVVGSNALFRGKDSVIKCSSIPMPPFNIPTCVCKVESDESH